MGDRDWIIEHINATMSMEGMPLDEQDRTRIRECLDGEKSFQQAVEELAAGFRAMKGTQND